MYACLAKDEGGVYRLFHRNPYLCDPHAELAFCGCTVTAPETGDPIMVKGEPLTHESLELCADYGVDELCVAASPEGHAAHWVKFEASVCTS